MEEKQTVHIVERLAEVLVGEDIDDIIPALAGLLANAGYHVCSDKELFVQYVTEVIDRTYEGDGETLQ